MTSLHPLVVEGHVVREEHLRCPKWCAAAVSLLVGVLGIFAAPLYLSLLGLSTRYSERPLAIIGGVDCGGSILLCAVAVLVLLFDGLPGRRTLAAIAGVRLAGFLAGFGWLIVWHANQPHVIGQLCRSPGVKTYLGLAFVSGVLSPVILLLGAWRQGRFMGKAMAGWCIALLGLTLPAAASCLQPMLGDSRVLAYLVLGLEGVAAAGLVLCAVGFARGASWSRKLLLSMASLKFLVWAVGTLYLVGLQACGKFVGTSVMTGLLDVNTARLVLLASGLGPALTVILLLLEKCAIEDVRALGGLNVIVGLLGLPVAGFLFAAGLGSESAGLLGLPLLLRGGFDAALSSTSLVAFAGYLIAGLAIIKYAAQLRGRWALAVALGDLFLLLLVTGGLASPPLGQLRISLSIFLVATVLPVFSLGLIGSRVAGGVRGAATSCLVSGLQILATVPGLLALLALALFHHGAAAQLFGSGTMLYGLGFFALSYAATGLILVAAARALWKAKPVGRRLSSLASGFALTTAALAVIAALTSVLPRLSESGLSALLGVYLTHAGALSLFAFVVFPLVLTLLMNWRSLEARLVYPGETAKGRANALFENVRTWGHIPRLRKSCIASVLAHAVVVLAPLFIIHVGCVEPYGPPVGDPLGPRAKKSPPLRIRPRRRVTVLMSDKGPAWFDSPKPHEVEVPELEEATRHDYTGLVGTTGQGQLAGFRDGIPGGKVRFIRLKYDGGDWDQDMGVGADNNMLRLFHERTGLACKDRTEYVEIAELADFPEGQGPPFVYITGKKGIDVSQDEVKILRGYLQNQNGMLFADHGGGHFGHAIRQLVGRVLPGKDWIDIPDDDEIYECRYEFPNGPPPLWHHDGTRPLGIKYEGRWVVYYHPGDVNDAWKDGHSGASPGVTEEAYRLGVNVMHYSFVKYMDYLEDLRK